MITSFVSLATFWTVYGVLIPSHGYWIFVHTHRAPGGSTIVALNGCLAQVYGPWWHWFQQKIIQWKFPCWISKWYIRIADSFRILFPTYLLVFPEKNHGILAGKYDLWKRDDSGWSQQLSKIFSKLRLKWRSFFGFPPYLLQCLAKLFEQIFSFYSTWPICRSAKSCKNF